MSRSHAGRRTMTNTLGRDPNAVQGTGLSLQSGRNNRERVRLTKQPRTRSSSALGDLFSQSYGNDDDQTGTWSAGHVFYDTTDGPVNIAANTPTVQGLYLVIARVAAAGTGEIEFFPGDGWATATAGRLVLDGDVGAASAAAYQPAGGVFGPIAVTVQARTSVDIVAAANPVGRVLFEYYAALQRTS